MINKNLKNKAKAHYLFTFSNIFIDRYTMFQIKVKKIDSTVSNYIDIKTMPADDYNVFPEKRIYGQF